MPGSNVTGLSAFSSSPLLVPVVNLYTTSVVLEAMQGSFAALGGTLGFTPNQLEVAKSLDSLLTKSGGKTGVFPEIDFLDRQFLSLKGNLDKISPEELTAVFDIAKGIANLTNTVIGQRLEDIRSQANADGASSGADSPARRGRSGGPVARSRRHRAMTSGACS